MMRMRNVAGVLGCLVAASIGPVAYGDSGVEHGATDTFSISHADGGAGTYVPGRTVQPTPYSMRGTATRRSPDARGGGPRSDMNTRATPRAMPRGRQSDNQTRRPGATNYTGSSFKPGPDEPAHTVPDAPPVSLEGDHFESHTGAANRGQIGAPAPSTNEREFWKTNQLRSWGGGPSSQQPVVLPDGTIERPSSMGPITWGVDPNAPRTRPMPMLDNPNALTKSDLEALPMPFDGTAVRSRGLLAMGARDVRSSDFIPMGIAGAEPSREVFAVGYPRVRAFGGGPLPPPSDPLQRALDRIPAGNTQPER